MATVTPDPNVAKPQFPGVELEKRLRKELTKVADESDVLHGDWDPVLDSLRVVSVLLEIEDLFPGIKLPPEKLIRQGGYRSVDEGVADISRTLLNVWNQYQASRNQ